MQDSVVVGRRVSSRNGVAAGSVWETRMKMDEVRGGIKVFNGSNQGKEDSNSDNEGMRVYQKLMKNQTDSIGGGRRKRRSWGIPEPVDSFFTDRTPWEMQIQQDFDVADELEMEIDVVEETRSFDDKEMDQQALEKLEEKRSSDAVLTEKIFSSFKVEKKHDSVLQASQNIEKEQNLDTVLSQKVEKFQNGAVLSSKVAKKDDIVSESPANVKQKRYSVFQAWSKLEKKQSLIAAAASRRRDKDNSVTLTSVNAEKKQNYVYSASLKMDNLVIERMKKSEQDRGNQSNSKAPAQVPSGTHHCHHRMQRIGDLIMWKDVKRSACVFAFGMLILVAFSYAEDFNFNSISSASYLALSFLASIFIYKSVLSRGKRIDSKERNERYSIGEEEAILLLKMVLPYMNEMILNLKAIFSGDPATTMKLAVLLLVMAKCGSFISVWNLAKLTLFAVFTVPKLYSSYSNQLTMHVECWSEKLRESWESSNHKKTIIVTLFIVIWSISSTAARIWSVFFFIVAMKYYQQRSEDEKIKRRAEIPASELCGRRN